MTDFTMFDSGSMILFTPNTDEAKLWCADYLGHEETQMLGNAYAIEPRYFEPIWTDLLEQGFTIQ